MTPQEKEKLLEHRKKMDAFYSKRPNIVKFILDFFKLKKGIRCRARLEPLPNKNGKQHYTRYDTSLYDWTYGKGTKENRYKYPLCTINRRNIEEELIKAKTLFFYECIFSKDATRCNSTDELIDCIIGITPVMDIDSPHIYPIERFPDGRKKRIDTLSVSGIPVMEKFDEIRLIAKEELEKVEMWDDVRMMHSGNGMYIILPDFYGSIEEIDEYVHAVNLLINDINIDVKQSLIETLPVPVSWSKFFKIPFTFHNDYPRLSIPIDKNAKVAYKVSTKDW